MGIGHRELGIGDRTWGSAAGKIWRRGIRKGRDRPSGKHREVTQAIAKNRQTFDDKY
ncbi:hypothetical protein H6G33_36580 [Calothrix sp. FACHB-1219]|uniref:hypothetical protein n=1 Tax=unclassified Calothrix TaxID=2619626 RepID=UPI001687599A|nr:MULTISPECIES: hypothetical protein [unclassified Calothrix]MBD2207815.1 hypothetical protein [Calothrix sp. FACHB-168]MBD2222449.1 hypothetical protein [Calothrix sp. FACHB-1219]